MSRRSGEQVAVVSGGDGGIEPAGLLSKNAPENVVIAEEGDGMRITDAHTLEILVEREPAGARVELVIGDVDTEDARIVRLTREEARRLAALILFEAARLDRPAASWAPSPRHTERRVASSAWP